MLFFDKVRRNLASWLWRVSKSVNILFSNSVSFSLRKGLGTLFLKMKTLALVTKGIFAIGLVEISAVVLKKKMHIRKVYDGNNTNYRKGSESIIWNPKTEAEHRPIWLKSDPRSAPLSSSFFFLSLHSCRQKKTKKEERIEDLILIRLSTDLNIAALYR